MTTIKQGKAIWDFVSVLVWIVILVVLSYGISKMGG